jgi:hypothetical protein
MQLHFTFIANRNFCIGDISHMNVTTFSHALYVIVTILCIFMMFWILVFPSALWYEHSTIHRTLVEQWFGSMSSIRAGVNRGVGTVSPDLITKYQGQYLVQLLHIFPGAVWSAIVPLQLNTRFRRNHRALHKTLGYAFVGTATLVGMGVPVIIWRGLSHENFFHDIPPSTYSSSPGILLLSTYYLGTIFRACYFVSFKVPIDYHQHLVWIVRHVAAGIWIALQRILLGSPLYNQPTMTRLQQRHVFGHSALVSMIITILFGEILIFLWDIQFAKNSISEKNRKAI